MATSFNTYTTSFSFASGACCFDGTYIWSASSNGSGGVLLRVNPASGAITTYQFSPDVGGVGIIFAFGSLWVAAAGTARLWEFSTAGVLLNSYDYTSGALPGSGWTFANLCSDGTSLWVTVYYFNATDVGAVLKIDPSDGSLLHETIVGQDCTDALFDGTSIWTANGYSGAISQVRPSDGVTLQTVVLGDNIEFDYHTQNIAFDGTDLWVLENGNSPFHLYQVSTAGTLLNTFDLTNQLPLALAFAHGNLWVAIDTGGGGFSTLRYALDGSLAETIVTPAGSGVTHNGQQPFAYDGSNLWMGLYSDGANAVFIEYLLSPPVGCHCDTVPELPNVSDWIVINEGATSTDSVSSVSTVGVGKVFTTAGGGSIPAGWQAANFDDSAWSAPVQQTHSGAPVAGAQLITDLNSSRTNQPYFDLFRFHFTVTGPPLSGSLTLNANADDKVYAVYVNGSAVSITAGGSITVSVPYSMLVSGDNVLAIQVQDNIPFYVSASYTLAGTIIIDAGSSFVSRKAKGYYGQGQQNTFSQQLRQRGQAQIEMHMAAGDTYSPVRGQPIYLYDETAADGFILVYAGLIQDINFQLIGRAGDRYILLNAVSFEAIFDTVYATPVQYVNETAGFIVKDLLCRFECGSQVSAGTINDGPTIALFNTDYQTLTDLFSQLATASQFTWGVDIQTQTLFFRSPASAIAPFTLTDEDILWEQIDWKELGADVRFEQAVRVGFSAFGISSEFFVGAGQQSFTLRHPANQVTNAYATLSTCNTATGSLSGQPSDGDTLTISVPNGAWQASHAYATGGAIVVDGYLQIVTSAGTSGGSQPTFATVNGETTVDGTVIWTCQGALGLANGNQVYTWRNTIDNTLFGDVLIGATADDSLSNMVDAINANDDTRGTAFSLPTWENVLCNAIDLSGTSFTIQQKGAGSGTTSALSRTGTAFSWSGAITSGGTSPQGSLGPGEGATIELQVYTLGSSVAAPGLAYVPGSNVVTLATPLNVGSNLAVGYTRAGNDVLRVRDDSLVSAFAAVTRGTGKLQQITDLGGGGLVATSGATALLFAQEALAAYKIAPKQVTIKTYKPGLQVGQTVTVDVIYPTGFTSLFNGDWVIEEISGELVPAEPWLGQFGHWKYTLRLINKIQIGSWLDYWQNVGGGSGGASGGPGTGSSLVATSGGAQSTTGTTPATGGAKVLTANYAAVTGDSGILLVFDGSASPLVNPTLTLPATAPGAQWNVFVENIGVGNLTIDPNGRDLDGSASTLTLTQNQGVYLTTDGTNYFTERGVGGAGSGTVNSVALTVPARQSVAGSPVTIAGTLAITDNVQSANQIFAGPASGGSATPAFRAIAAADLPVATSAALGAVKPDGTIITVAAGAITVPKASSSAFGVVEVDGTTITAAAGVISAVGGSGTVTHTGGALTADQPVFGAGGGDIKVGTKSGNTDEIVTQSGAATAGRVLLYDASGNAIASTIQGNTTQVQMASGSPTTGYALIYDASGNAVPASGPPLANPMTTKGDVIVAATGGTPARLAVGTNGQVLTANSGATNGEDWEAPIALTTTGTSGAATLTPGNPYTLNVPQYSGGGGSSPGSGGGGGSAFATYTVPTISQFTVFGSPSATVADTATGITVTGAANTGANYVRSAGLTTTWNIEFGMLCVMGPQDFFGGGLLMRNGSSGAFMSILAQHATTTNANNPLQFVIQQLNSSGGFVSNVFTKLLNQIFPQTGALYFRVQDNGTTRTYYVSPDLLIWMQVFSEARGTTFAVDRGGFTLFGSTSYGPCYRIIHYKEY